MTRRFRAFHIGPSGKRHPVRWMGLTVFPWRGVRAIRRRARRGGWRKDLVVRRVAPTWRARMLEAMKWALAHEGAIHYQQSRPFPVNAIRDRHLPIYTDCSGSTTMLYRAAGVKDPNGNEYDGTGYTGTLRANTPRTPLAELRVGDFIVHGPGAGSHVVVVFQPHPTDPLCFSHGQESGPRLYRHSVQTQAHGGYFTCHGFG